MQYPLINGVRPSFSSIELSFGGRSFIGFTSISYSQNLEAGEARGASPQKLSDTRGDLKAEGSVTIYLNEDAELIGAMGEGFLEQYFNITVNYSSKGTAVITDRIIGGRFKGGGRDHSKGTDAVAVKRDFMAFYIIENGNSPIYNLQTQ